jgi:hypothetical protein
MFYFPHNSVLCFIPLRIGIKHKAQTEFVSAAIKLHKAP